MAAPPYKVRRTNAILIIGFGAILACMLGLLSVGIGHLRAAGEARQTEAALQEKVRMAYLMREALRKRAFSLTYVSTLPDYFDRDEEQIRFSEYAGDFIDARSRLMKLGLEPDEVEPLNQVRDKIVAAQPIVDRAMAMAVEGGDTPEFKIEMDAALKAQFGLLAAIDILVAQLDTSSKRKAEAAAQARDRTRQRLLLFGVGMFLSSLVIAVIVIRRESWSTRTLIREIAEREQAEARVRDLNKTLEARVARRTQELAESEARSRAIVETAVDGIITIDEKGVIESFNPAAERIFGYHRDEVLGRNVSLLMPEPYQSEHDGYLLRYMVSGEKRIMGAGRELEGLRKDGTIFPLSLAVSEMTVDGRRLFVGITDDISARKRAEADMRTEKERAERYLDVAEAMFVELDREGRVMRLNRQGCDILGCSADKIIGNNWFRHFLPKDRRDEAWKIFLAMIGGKDEMFRYVESEVLTRNNERRHILWHNKALRDPQGTVISILSSGQDVTRYRRQQETLRQAKNEAEFANRAKSEFLANMSHELRTPLNAIIGFSDMMRMQALGNLSYDLYKEYLDDIHASGEHLLALVNDILDVAKIEAGQLELHEEKFSLSDISESALRLTRPRATERGIKLNANLGTTLPELRADRRLVKQMLLNLLTNAVKFSHAGGEVSLAAHVNGSGELCLLVSDQGIGMAPDDITRALSPFAQVGRGTFAEHEGTGLGLPLTKGLVEAHGGRLDLKSTIGQGTTVTLHFPSDRVVTPN